MARAGEGDIKDRLCGVMRNFTDDDIVKHPKYEAGVAYYDVAVVHLERRIMFNRFMQPICLPPQPTSNQDEHADHMMRLAGV